MSEWDYEYEELLEEVQWTYMNYIEQGLSERLAIARTLYDYETIENEGELETIIISVAIGQIASSHKTIFIGRLNYVIEMLSKFEENKFADKLSKEELQDLSARIKNVLATIKKMPIEYKPGVES
ncbi:Imm3 family immunity protein [Paenibacillus kandeliae]|uniref:Imm3 family immunity protein n=1 Tax=Paenibacillus kandeliae TaxID=3231269 RepID=UPI00345B3B9C